MKKLVLFVSTIVAIAFSSCSCEGDSCSEEAVPAEAAVIEVVDVVEADSTEAIEADSTEIVEEVVEEVVAEEAPAAE